MTTRTITALFDRYEDAARAVRALEASGVAAGDISVVSNDAAERGRYGTTATRDESEGGGAGTGAAFGTILGGGAGMLAGLGLMAIPGLGPVVAAGWLVSTLVGAGAGAATGAVVGSLAGSLTETGVSEADAHAYAEGVRRGGTLVTVRADEVLADRVVAILDDEGTVDLDERSATWRQEGWTGYDSTVDMPSGYAAGTTAATTDTSAMPPAAGLQEERAAGVRTSGAAVTDEEAATIPVVEEDVRIGKREVGGGRVRVRSYVTERPVEEQVDLRQERVSVERRPVDRPLGAGEAAFQDREIAAVERGEEAVIDKRARVVEEVALNKDVDTRTATVRDTARRTEVEVEDDRNPSGAGVVDATAGTTGRER